MLTALHRAVKRRAEEESDGDGEPSVILPPLLTATPTAGFSALPSALSFGSLRNR
jgi:hypothetical protein